MAASATDTPTRTPSSSKPSDVAWRSLQIANSPAAMNVRLLLPEEVSFSQTDKYAPEPGSTARSWKNTWHLSVSTVDVAPSAGFLSVFLPYREGAEDQLPKVKRLDGEGAVVYACRGPTGLRTWSASAQIRRRKLFAVAAC